MNYPKCGGKMKVVVEVIDSYTIVYECPKCGYKEATD